MVAKYKINERQRQHKIKAGESREDVAERFGVSVKELINYNRPVLGDNGDWNAGVIVRDPSYYKVQVSRLREAGIPDKRIAQALRMTEQKLVKTYGPRSKPIRYAEKDEEPVLTENTVPQRTQKKVPAPYTDYESVLPDFDPSMYRADGSRKSSRGYLGPQTNKKTGQTMTEYTIGVQMDGKEVEIPSMVPGLTDKEVDAIRSGEVLDSVAVKAKAHAEQRIAQGKSPFYQDLEEYTDYESAMDQRPSEVTVPQESEPVPEIDVYGLLGDPNEIISQGAENYYKNWTNKWGDTPVDEIPEEDLVKMSGFFFNAYKDTPIDLIPKNVLPLVMNTLIQVTAEDTKGTYKKWATSLPDVNKMQNVSEMAAFSFLNAIPFYNPDQETVSQFGYMSGSSLRGNIDEPYSLQKEFEYRVRRLQSGAGIVTGPELSGAITDPAGVVGGAFTGGMVKANKLSPVIASLLGNTIEGGAYGALMPVYPEFGDSRLLNMTGGAILGFGLTSTLLSPVIAGQTAQSLARKAVVKTPEQQRLYPNATPIERTEAVPFLETRVPAEREALLKAQSQEPRGVEVSIDPQTPTSLDVPKATLNVKPYVASVSKTVTPEQAKKTVTESNLDIRVIDQQIAQLENKIVSTGSSKSSRAKRKRRPLQEKLALLKEARIRRLEKIDEALLHNNSRIIKLNKIVSEAASNPSKKGSIPRAIRAKRTALKLEKENMIYLTGGHVHIDWADPIQTSAFRSFAINSGNKFVVPPSPVQTGNVIEDTIANLNYTISTGSRRNGDSAVTFPVERDTIGFEPLGSLSSAGARPSTIYADELAALGYGEDSIPGFGVSTAKARKTYKEDPDAFSGVAPELRTQEAMGRDIINEEATQAQRALIQGELAGYSPDEIASSMEQIAYRTEGGWDNLEQLAARIREEDIAQGYNSMVDFVMDPSNKTKLMSGEFTEALQPLWIQAENRRTQYGQRLYDLQQEGLVNSPAYVQSFNEYMLATHVTDIYRAIGSARGRALNQLKKMKRLMNENARKTKKGIIIDNLFGVKCG